MVGMSYSGDHANPQRNATVSQHEFANIIEISRVIRPLGN